MRAARAFVLRLRGLWRKRDEDLDAEIRSHLELHIADNLRAGMSPEQARRQALMKLGGVEQVKEAYRDRRGVPLLEHLIQDLRYGLRQLRRNPGFAAVAVLSLALGIGANTAIFSFMDAILMRSLPAQDPESLVVLEWHAKSEPAVAHSFSGDSHQDPKIGRVSGNFPYGAFELFRSNPVFSNLFTFSPGGRFNILANGQAELMTGGYVSGDFFTGLGTAPAAGRLIEPEDDRAGAPAVAVVSFGYSQAHFGSAAGAVGQTISVNNVPFPVVGVTPPGFFGVDPQSPSDLYLPIHTTALQRRDQSERFTNPNFYWVQMMGRLRPGVSAAQAQAAVAPVFGHFVESTASNDKERADLPQLLIQPGAGGLDFLRRLYRDPLYVLMTMVGLILAIGCANIANLLLARSSARRREIAVRLGLGAGRFRIARQLLTESILLSGIGGGLGVVFASWGIRSLTFLLGNGRPNFTLHAELNWRVLGVTIALSIATGILFGLAPAIQAMRIDVTPALKEDRVSGGRGEWRRLPRVSLSQMLVAAQIAMSVLLLAAAGLFVHNLSNLQSIVLGFNRENVLLFNLNAGQAGYRDQTLIRFYDDLQTKFRGIPGVKSVSLTDFTLVSGSQSSTGVTIPGTPPGSEHRTSMLLVGPSFFATMQIPMVAGREIDEHDTAASPGVAVVNERFAKEYFHGEYAVGRSIGLAGKDWEIAGISRDARYNSLKDEIPPVAYLAYRQGVYGVGGVAYELRTTGDPLSYVNTVRQIVRQADGRIPVANVKTQATQIDQGLSQERIFAMLCSAFAVLALAIASIGLYGTMAYTVARRTNEIGIRMALGARRGRVMGMILREVGALTAAGLAIGLAVAFGTSKYLASFIFQLKPNDPAAIVGAVGILVAAAMAAGYLPARRASRIDPMAALRHE